MGSILNIGINSLNASKNALSITNHNIANANNPNYSRRVIDLEEITQHIYGSGVKVGDVRRIVDKFASQTLIKASNNYAYANAGLGKLKDLESLLDGDASGLNQFINQSVSELNTLNANASSRTSRNIYMQKLGDIAGQFNVLHSELNRVHADVKNTLELETNTVNELTAKVAELNQSIFLASAQGTGENQALLDQRDKLLNTLSQFIGFRSQVDDKGMANIQVGKGTPLVNGTESYQLTLKHSIADSRMLEVQTKDGSNLNETALGGSIGALIDFQRDIFQESMNHLGRMALAMSNAFNEQNKLGMDLRGDLGGNIFTDINDIALMNGRAVSHLNNTGSAALSVRINEVNDLTTSNYTLVFDNATDYRLIRASDEVVFSGNLVGAPPHAIAVDGFEITINGAPAGGDSFKIIPARDAADAMALTTHDGNKLALAFPVVSDSSKDNTGNGRLTITEITDVTTAAFSVPKTLSPPIRVEFQSPTLYQLVNADDDTLIDLPQVYDPVNGQGLFPTSGGYDPGYRVQVAGDIRAGDEFYINYNSKGAGDNRNGLLLAECYKKGIVENGGLNITQAYTSLSGDISSKTHAAGIRLDTQEAIKIQAEERRNQISGVSIEEETVNIARFEQSYVASAQIIDVTRRMFEIVCNLIRG